MNRLVLLAVLAVVFSCSPAGDADFINTSIGVTDSRGSNCVVGPRFPYGSIYPSPQTENGSTDGYDPDSPIRGFAQMHVSGTGWSSYGHFLISPQIGLSLGKDNHDSPHSEDVTKAFYYSTHLDRYDITTEIVPSHYCAMYRFTYPESKESYVVLDASQCIMDIAEFQPRGTFSANSAEIDKEGRVKMMLTFEGGWPSGAYNLYLVGEFDHKPSEVGVWRGESVLPGKTVVSGVDEDASHIGAFVRFDTSGNDKVQMKLAVSFTSFEKAGEFLSAEMSGWDFDRQVTLAREEWDKKLSSIKITSKDETERTLFYSALFRFYTLASERTADNAKWKSDIPFWDDNYAYWDTFRSAYPLMMLIDTPAMSGNLNSMIDRFEHNGAVYDGFIAGSERPSEQGGNDVDHIIAESYLKGIEGVDWEKAYAIVRKNAEKRRAGNEGDGIYRELGWIPNCVMSCSQSLEYSYNDYCAHLMAKGLGHDKDAEKYLERSGKWINMWNPELESDGFRGFIDALNADGSFASIDPKIYGGSWISPFYEAGSWTYSYYVPHDIKRLIELMGGPDEYVRRLMHAYENGLIEYTNEPAFLVTRTFSDAGRPDLCSYWTHKIMDNYYDMDGYPGNEDTGAMGSWYVFSAVGLFPNAGQDYYYLNAPRYTESILDLGKGKKLTIRSDAAPGKVYIKSCKVGGVEWNKATITHEELVGAGLIEMELSDTPTGWAVKDYDVTFSGLLEEMTDPSFHARWPVHEYVCRQSSSYSRASVTPATAAEDSKFRPESGRDWGKGWFENHDFDNYIREEIVDGQTEYVMQEDNGPGAILGFWTAYGGYLDGEGGDYIIYIDEKPVVRMQNKSLVGGTGLVGYPFSYVAPARTENLTWLGHNLTLPIPYSRSCKISFRPYDPSMTAKTHGHYYQIIYRSYKPGTKVESFDENTIKKYAKEIYACGVRLTGDKSIQDNAVRKAGGCTLAAGARKTLSLKGERCITSLSIQLDAPDISEALSKTILKIKFDGEQTVECPVGNFFGIGYKQLSNCTFYVRTNPDGMMTAYWVMPFEKKAEVTLENNSSSDVELKVFQTTSKASSWDPDRSMHFYAQYRESKDLDGSVKYDYNFVTIEGKGRYVADGLTVFTYYPEGSGHDWWGEGDEKIFVDGEAFPSHFGTGTEDYYRYAYCRPQPFSYPSISQPIGDGNKTPGLSVNNRYRLLDDIPFEKSFAFYMEIWHPFYDRMDYAPATFWYAFPGCKFTLTE